MKHFSRHLYCFQMSPILLNIIIINHVIFNYFERILHVPSNFKLECFVCYLKIVTSSKHDLSTFKHFLVHGNQNIDISVGLVDLKLLIKQLKCFFDQITQKSHDLLQFWFLFLKAIYYKKHIALEGKLHPHP